jgi:hypothetical protein
VINIEYYDGHGVGNPFFPASKEANITITGIDRDMFPGFLELVEEYFAKELSTKAAFDAEAIAEMDALD